MGFARTLEVASGLIEKRPDKVLGAFAVAHLILWTVLPSLLYPNLPLDLIEALTYGREWQLGYDKLPPLPWWIVEIAYRVVGADFAYYFVSQVTVLAAFAAVWACARKLVGERGALLSVLIIDGIHFFGFTAPKFNHDVTQLPFWALAGFAFHSALRNGRLSQWAVLGFALGGALWAKYFVVVLALALVLFLLLDPAARRTLTTPGPYVAAGVMLLVAAPHLVWLVQNDFLPFHYAEARSALKGHGHHALNPFLFVAAQLGWLIPSLLIASPLFYPPDKLPRTMSTAKPDAFDRRIVTLLAFGPAAVLLVGALASGRGLVSMWGYPLWLYLGLWIVMMAPLAYEQFRVVRLVGIWGLITTIYAIAFIIQYGVLPHFDHRYRASVFPGDRLAVHIADGFRAATGRPLAYVISTMWLGGNIGHYTTERPRTLIDGKPARAPWIDLSDLRARGAAVVWIRGDTATLPAEYAGIADGAEVQPPFTLPMRWGNGEVTFGWAVLKPTGDDTHQSNSGNAARASASP
jgi:4-amino-4-deoxy-L-arabinose transferase-like glycosyltransferase